MSVMYNTYEILEVNTSSEESRGFIKHIVDYVDQFNNMRSLESLSGFKMTISADGINSILECENAEERNNTYVMTGEGLVVNSVEHIIWDKEEVDRALSGLNSAKQIRVEFEFSLFKLLGYEYGFSYWSALLDEENKLLRENVSYKCQEWYDSDPEVVTFKFTKDFAGFVDYESTEEDVACIKSWYSDNFELRAYTDEDYDEETVEKLTTLSKSFAEKYNFLNDVEPPYENEYILYDTLTFSGSFSKFADDLQEIVDVLVELDADIEFSGTFTPNEENAFASVDIVLEDGKFNVKYCNY